MRQLHDDTDITVHLRAVVEIDESSEEALELAQKLTHEAGGRYTTHVTSHCYTCQPIHEAGGRYTTHVTSHSYTCQPIHKQVVDILHM